MTTGQRTKVRLATPADCEVLAAIHATAFNKADRWSVDVFGLQLDMPGIFALIHPAGGLILLRVTLDEAEILTLAVVPEARRSGIASDLLRHAVSRLISAHVTALFLEVSVNNAAARALYVSWGFERVGCRRHYYSDSSDALILRLDIPPAEPAGAA